MIAQEYKANLVRNRADLSGVQGEPCTKKSRFGAQKLFISNLTDFSTAH